MKSKNMNIYNLQKKKLLNRNKYLKQKFSIATAKNIAGGKCGCNKFGGGKKSIRYRRRKKNSKRNK